MREISRSDRRGEDPIGGSVFGEAICVGFVVCLSVLLYLLYFSPVHLHDIAHYLTAGVSLLRDRADLIYPYHPHSADGLGPAYEHFQSGAIEFGARWNYPAKLYSALLGSIALVAGSVKLEYAHYVSLCAWCIANAFSFLIFRKYLSRVNALLLCVSVVFLPVMFFNIAPTSDSVGYACGAVLIWLTVAGRISMASVGIVLGLFAHTRPQLLVLLAVLPLLRVGPSQATGIWQRKWMFLITSLSSYLAVSMLFVAFIEHHAGNAGNPVDFYVRHFRSSFYGLAERGLIADSLIANIANLFSSKVLYLFSAMFAGIFLFSQKSLERRAVIAAAVWAVFPIVTYSLDRFSNAHDRYFLISVLLLALSAAVASRHVSDANARKLTLGFATLAGVVVLTWVDRFELPMANLNGEILESRLEFLDFAESEAALSRHFDDDAIVVINHSLVTAISRLSNVIYVPPYQLFHSGDNSRIDGMAFVYGVSGPNDFFQPKDWMVEGQWPEVIVDKAGLTFAREYLKDSTLLNRLGQPQQVAWLVIYRRVDQEGLRSP